MVEVMHSTYLSEVGMLRSVVVRLKDRLELSTAESECKYIGACELLYLYGTFTVQQEFVQGA